MTMFKTMMAALVAAIAIAGGVSLTSGVTFAQAAPDERSDSAQCAAAQKRIDDAKAELAKVVHDNARALGFADAVTAAEGVLAQRQRELAEATTTFTNTQAVYRMAFEAHQRETPHYAQRNKEVDRVEDDPMSFVDHANDALARAAQRVRDFNVYRTAYRAMLGAQDAVTTAQRAVDDANLAVQRVSNPPYGIEVLDVAGAVSDRADAQGKVAAAERAYSDADHCAGLELTTS